MSAAGGTVLGNGFDLLCKAKAVDDLNGDDSRATLKRAKLEFGAHSIARAGGRALILENSSRRPRKTAVRHSMASKNRVLCKRNGSEDLFHVLV
jgi:hypothetical protein